MGSDAWEVPNNQDDQQQTVDAGAQVSIRHTRKKHNWECCFRQRQIWERDPHVQEALQALSMAATSVGGYGKLSREAWTVRLQAEAAHHQVLYEEYVLDKGRAKWAMSAYRCKRSSMDRAANAAVRSGDCTRPLYMGIGNGGYACGESVPTKGFEKALQRAILRSKRTIVQLSIDEFRTTIGCNGCGLVNRPATLNSGSPSTRCRFCSFCNNQGRQGTYDRDHNAALNILLLTRLMVHGLQRPAYMSRQG
eukprot:jgi/Chrzof1/8005/UNPLg00056.t1